MQSPALGETQRRETSVTFNDSKNAVKTSHWAEIKQVHINYANKICFFFQGVVGNGRIFRKLKLHFHTIFHMSTQHTYSITHDWGCIITLPRLGMRWQRHRHTISLIMASFPLFLLISFPLTFIIDAAICVFVSRQERLNFLLWHFLTWKRNIKC